MGQQFFEIVLSNKKCEKGLDSLPKPIREEYEEWESLELAIDPTQAASGTLRNGEKLFKVYPKPVYKKRFGDYRVLYVVRATTGNKAPGHVLIIRIKHRSEAYV